MNAAEELATVDALGMADLVRQGQCSPLDLVDAAADRIEALNPQINAIVARMYDEARQAARDVDTTRPFCGVPFLVKDLLSPLAGAPMQNGSRFFRGYVPPVDSELMRRYRAAGLIPIAKTSVPELGIMPVTEPQAFGACRNPWNLERTPGGSSGGAAAAVAAGMVPMAHGNDGGGSIRVPASCCGLFGLKPTRGRNPLGPTRSEAWRGLAVDHVLTLSVRDSAAALDATSGPDPGAPYACPDPPRPFLDELRHPPGKLRIAYHAEPLLGGDPHPDCVAGLDETVELCRELGHELIPARPPVDAAVFNPAFLTMVCGEVRADILTAEIALGRQARPRDFEPATWVLGMLGEAIGGGRVNLATRQLQNAAREMAPFFEEHDVFLTPTLSRPPLPIGVLQPAGFRGFMVRLLARLNVPRLTKVLAGIEEVAEETLSFVPYTPPFNVSGQPAMSVPLFWNDGGLPIGMQFVGRFGDEATLFRLAAQLEQARPWIHRRAPVSAPPLAHVVEPDTVA